LVKKQAPQREPSGELDHAPRRLDRKAVVNLRRDLFGGIPIVRIVDHSLDSYAGAAHDRRTGHPSGHAFNVRTLRLVYFHETHCSRRAL
jgi:hypothetical protein